MDSPDMETCPECAGDGEVWDGEPAPQRVVRCELCSGLGKITAAEMREYAIECARGNQERGDDE